MFRQVFYTILILSFWGVCLIFGFAKMSYKDVVFSKNGLQFESQTKQDVVFSSFEPIFFMGNDEKGKVFYHYNPDMSFKTGKNFYSYRHINNDMDINVMSYNAVHQDILYSDSINLASTSEIHSLVKGMRDFQSRKLITYSLERGWFGFIDDSPLIFIFGSFIFFIFCFLVSGLSKLLSRISNRFRIIVPFIFACIFPLFSHWMTLSTWFPYTDAAHVTKIIFTTILSFFLFRYIIEKTVNKSFSEKETIKFFGLIFGSLAICWVVARLTYMYDSIIYDDIIFRPGMKMIHPLVIAFIISLATGNLFSNLVRYMIRSRKNKRLLKKAETKITATEATMQSLQSSINPHFLYNSLNSIASTAQTDGAKTEKMAIALSTFYKYITNKQDKTVTTLSDEVEMIKNYLEIEKIRFGTDLNVQFDISESTQNTTLPRFILQPIVENAIKYGYGEDGISIIIKSILENKNLIITVSDSGPPFDDIQMGYGLKSVIKKLNVYFPDQHALEFFNSPIKHVLIRINQSK